MHKRAYLGLGFSLALGIIILGLFTAGSTRAQTIGQTTVSVPATGGTTTHPCGGTVTFPPGAVPAGSIATIAELVAPPPGTTLPGVGSICELRVTGPNGQAITSFSVPVTFSGTGNACYILNEATGRFEELSSTLIGGGMVECSVPRPGIIAVVTETAPTTPTTPGQTPGQAPGKAGVAPGQAPGKAGVAPGQAPGKAGVAPGQAPGKAGVAPAQAPGKAGVAPAQAPGKAGVAPAQAPGLAGVAAAQTPGVAGVAPGQAPAALPRTGGETLPVGGLAIAGLLLAGLGIATRRFGRD